MTAINPALQLKNPRMDASRPFQYPSGNSFIPFLFIAKEFFENRISNNTGATAKGPYYEVGMMSTTRLFKL
ncbi:MAG: hypothetical protein ACU85E_12665 [Gammaproteobacteria bacterium]